MARLVRDLVVREAQRRQARGDAPVVARTVGRLLHGRAVVAQAVALDDEPELRPVEVDPVRPEVALRARLREAGAARDRDEEALELGVGEDEGGRVEDGAQGADAGATLLVGERGTQRRLLDEVAAVRRVDGGLEALA